MNKVYWGYTQTQTSAYYRMVMFYEYMRKNKLVDVYSNEYDPDKLNSEVNLFEQNLSDPTKQADIEKDFLFLIGKKKVNLAIFQLFSSCWGLALLDIFHHFKLPVITEVDDYAFGVNTDNPNYVYYTPDSETLKIVRAQLKSSDALIVSTNELKDKYAQYCKTIYVIPNAVDFNLWNKLNNNTHKSFINIGWEGGSAHTRDINIVRPVVKQILKKYKNVRFTFVGGRESIPKEFKKNDRIKLYDKWIPITKYPSEKAKYGFDIELAPLFDTEFNRCKSNLRYLEASALKIPTVASNVGPYKDIVGYKCSTTEEWVDALSELIESRDIRIKTGKRAYLKVKKTQSLEIVANKYSEVVVAEIAQHKARLRRLKKWQ